MRTDESGAPWPYEETKDASEPPAPHWECPDGTCDCGAAQVEHEEHEFSVMLLSPEGERMSNARCRILYQDRILNEQQPYADASGWVTCIVPRVPATVLVEWAPASLPRDPLYPFRKRYYVDVDRDDTDAVRRRLHNLGYSRRLSITENIKDFQREYGYERISGKIEDIQADLLEFHDAGRVPLRPLGQDGATAGAGDAPGGVLRHGSAFQLSGDSTSSTPNASAAAPSPESKPDKAQAQPPAGQPPTAGKPSLGTGAAMTPLKFPPVLPELKAGRVFWEFICVGPIKANAGQDGKGDALEAYFWMTSDALMWLVPDGDPWTKWQESYCPLPNKPAKKRSILNRRRLCRLPCTPMDSQALADAITASQAELLQAAPIKPPSSPFPSATEGGGEASSLLPTIKLYDHLYESADIQISFQYVDGLGRRSLANMSNEYCVKVNTQLMAEYNRLTKTASNPGLPRALGTPGKIWAIHELMEMWSLKGDPPPKEPFVASVNYGFHQKVTPTKAFQGADVWHDLSHVDYSQIVVLVAGWCLVKRTTPGSATPPAFSWMETSKVYVHPDLCPLVMRTRAPAPRTRYTGTPRGDKKNPLKSGSK